MKNLLFFLGILCILTSCKKEYVEPITSDITTDSSNQLPTMAYTTFPNDPYKPVYRFAYYPNGLVKKIIQYDSIYHPDQKDSTLYTYNASNKVIETSEYSGGNLKYKTEITYNSSGNIETVWQQNAAYNQFSVTYQYVYASATDVAYVLKFDAANAVTDSIVVDNNVVYKYYKPEPGNSQYYDAVNGYASYNPIHCFITPTGAYLDGGIRSPNNPAADKWGYVYNDPSIKPDFLNKNITFQYEVAEKFIDMGLTGFPDKNFYITPGPRQYYIGNSYGKPSGYGTTYTFDQNDRLIKSTKRFDYYTQSGSAIPGYQTIEIRYE